MKDLLLAILSAYEARWEGELATKKLGSSLTTRLSVVGEGKALLVLEVKNAFRSMEKDLHNSRSDIRVSIKAWYFVWYKIEKNMINLIITCSYGNSADDPRSATSPL
jgi:hypothetical protein